eukprot:COSAG01_NODE_30420_length_616_cov_1.079304_1_plen_42_part_01
MMYRRRAWHYSQTMSTHAGITSTDAQARSWHRWLLTHLPSHT